MNPSWQHGGFFLYTKLVWKNALNKELDEMMNKIKLIALLATATLCLSGCLASSTSTKGVNCVQGTPFENLPVACIGGN
jgi:hypothetical protein